MPAVGVRTTKALYSWFLTHIVYKILPKYNKAYISDLRPGTNIIGLQPRSAPCALFLLRAAVLAPATAVNWVKESAFAATGAQGGAFVDAHCIKGLGISRSV